MAKKTSLDSQLVQKNIENLRALIQKHELDAFYISSFDPYLNEYVPMSNCHRFYFTNFSGSVAEVLVPKEGKVRIYVDGRYYEQADLEVDASLVEVVRVPGGMSLAENLVKEVKELGIKSLGLEAARTSIGLYKVFEKITTVEAFGLEVENLLEKLPMTDKGPIFLEEKSLVGKSVALKLKDIIEDPKEAYFVTALDSLAWVTNCRGYHLPNASSFIGKAIVCSDKVYVFIDKGVSVSKEAREEPNLEFLEVENTQFAEVLTDIHKKYNLEKLYIDPVMLNCQDSILLERIFGANVLEEKRGGLVGFHSIKSEAELETIKKAFDLGDQAIFNTIRWVKECVKKGERVSENDLYESTSINYKKMGSREQSFNTIAGVGANGSIIHYGDPKKDLVMKKDDMVLLDSGGYFPGGFATDTTRTFIAGDGQPSAKHKEIYTLVLKAVLGLQYAIFPEGTKGIELDAITRRPLWMKGYNYNHGTGHGVGINVHEGGVRISPLSDLPMKENQVVSLEPGIYLPGFGGVRLENIAIVRKHPEFKGMLCFENLVYIGFEPLLIEESMLTLEEKTWLEDYEKKCLEKKRSFRE